MTYLLLGIHCPESEQKVVLQKWAGSDLTFHFVDTIEEGAQRLAEYDYVCAIIYSDHVHQGYIDTLKRIKKVPVVILSPSCMIDQRIEFFQHSAMEYIIHNGQQKVASSSGKDTLHYYLDDPKREKQLTVITTTDFYFCLEYRIVEVMGQRVDLTEKEFDILALLITNQKQVFTHDMIIDAVWHEDGDFYSRNAVMTHISNLQKKLKVCGDAPDYIRNIRGAGYAFEAP